MVSDISINVTTQQGAVPVTIFHVKGEIDASSYEQLLAKAKEAFGSGMRALLLDLTQVAYISSAGIRAIHQVYAMLRTDAPEESDAAVSKGLRDGTFKSPHLKLLNPTGEVLEVLRTTGMDMYLEIHKDRDAAIASFVKLAAPKPEGIIVQQVQGRVPVTILKPHGDLDASNYKALIAKVQQVYDAGGRNVLLDLSEVPYMSSSGLVALHSAAKIMQAESPPDLNAGWDTLHTIDRERDQGVQEHLKVLNPQPEVDDLLETVGFKLLFEVYTDQAAAVASF